MGGAPSSATTAQQGADLTATNNQNAFDSQLMNIFQQQYSSQSSILSYLKNTVQPLIAQSEAGQGMSTAAETAMRTSATDQLSGQYQGAQAALNQQEASQMGGSNVLPSGTNAQLEAGLLNSEAVNKSSAQNQITQYNQSLANSNLWNGINALNGVAAQDNPLGYSQGATQGTGAIASASSAQAGLQNSINGANNSGFFGSLAQGLGGGMAGIGSSLMSNAAGL